MLGPQISRTGSRIPNLGNQGTEKTSTSAGHLEEDPLGDLGNQETEKTSISAGHLEEDPLGEVGAHHWEDIIEVAPVVSWTHRQLRLQKEKEERECWLEAELDNQALQVLDRKSVHWKMRKRRKRRKS